MTSAPEPPNDTRERLVQAAMQVFAEHGYGDVATRDLARAAGVSLSAIGYHFGSKLDLYRAAARRAAEMMAAPVDGRLAAPPGPPLTREASLEALIELVETVAGGMLAPGRASEAATQFGLRELVVSGPGADIIRERVLAPILGHAAALLRTISGGRLADSVLAAQAASLFGPITLYRILHNQSLGRMSPDEAADVQQVIRDVTRRYIVALTHENG